MSMGTATPEERWQEAGSIPILIPVPGAEPSGRGSCRVEQSSSVRARPVPHLQQPETMVMTVVGTEMKNVSAISMGWKHPAQGTEGAARPRTAVTPSSPARKGVPNASKTWNRSGAARLSAAASPQG